MKIGAFTNCWHLFWRQQPALFYGLCYLFGTYLGLVETWEPVVLPLAVLLFSELLGGCREALHRSIYGTLICFVAICYCHTQFHLPSLPIEGQPGTGELIIHDVRMGNHRFGKCWILQGTLRRFTTDSPSALVGKNVPVSVRIPVRGRQMPPVNKEYLVQGQLYRQDLGRYRWVPDKDTPWQPIGHRWSWAPVRWPIKLAVRNWILTRYHHSREGEFLAGLVTGDFSDIQSRTMLGRFGLQHIMAISGFHFAIIASILSVALNGLLPGRWGTLVLLTTLGFYCLFLGYSPSIFRAWIAATFALCAHLLERPSSSLNRMGLALWILVILDPVGILRFSFQMSFLATVGILLMFAQFDQCLQTLWKSRELKELTKWTRLDQHGYLLLALFRQGIALLMAVHVVTVPMTLYVFHKLPLLSLAYNLLFPFLVSIAILLLILGGISSLLLPPLGKMIDGVNSIFVHRTLNLTFNAPVAWEWIWRPLPPSLWSVILYLTVVLCVAIYFRQASQNQNRYPQEFYFL